MEFKAKIDYNREYLLYSLSHEFAYLLLAVKLLSLTPVVYLIYEAVRWKLVPHFGYGINIFVMFALSVVVIASLIWFCFNLPNIAAKSALRKLTRQNHDGKHTLIFNEQGLIVRSLKYSTERFYPTKEFKRITKSGEDFRLCIGTKRMYIKPSDFEDGDPDIFYKFIEEFCEN